MGAAYDRFVTPEPLTGVLTIVFTDMAGSTDLKQRLGDSAAVELIGRHHAQTRETLRGFPGSREVSTAGDSFLIVFKSPSEAVRFALRMHQTNAALTQQCGERIADRIGIHVGEVITVDRDDQPQDYHGIQVDLCARVMSLANPGQTLLTRFAFDNARQILPGGGLRWLNHGRFLLKGVEEPIEICEVASEAMVLTPPPTTSAKAKKHSAADGETVLGWRPAVDEVVPGTHWTLKEKLGEGGFGEVWLGAHAKLGEKRVFKFCFREDRARSLKREVTLFRLLKEKVGHHPNIVGIQEVVFNEPPFYLVMDYAEGKNLKAWFEEAAARGDVPLAVRLSIVTQIADALQAAHEAGIVHRDVKPANILVSGPPAGPVACKLTDFGIGQITSREALGEISAEGFTQTMMAASGSSQTGSHLYMAPELFAGQRATPRSDIYSLGVVLFQLIAGDFTEPLTTDWSKRMGDPILREDLARCFAGKIEERFGSAAELARNLRNYEARGLALRQEKAAQEARERAAYRRGVVRARATAGFVVFCTLALAVVIQIQKKQSSQGWTAATIAWQKERASRRTAEAREREVRRLLYFSNMGLIQKAWDDDNFSFMRILLDEAKDDPNRGFEWSYWNWKLNRHWLEVTNVAFLSGIEFDPGNKSIVFIRDGVVRAMELESRAERAFVASSDKEKPITRMRLSASGRFLATLQNETGDSMGTMRLCLHDARSGALLKQATNAVEGFVRFIEISRDDTRLMVVSPTRVRIWDIAEWKELPALQEMPEGSAFTGGAFSAQNEPVVAVTRSSGSTTNSLAIWKGSSPPSVYFAGRMHALSPDGSVLALVTSNGIELCRTADGKLARTLSVKQIRALAFSRRGNLLGVTGQFGALTIFDVKTGAQLGSLRTELSGLESVDFSSDEKLLATQSSEGNAKLWDWRRAAEPAWSAAVFSRCHLSADNSLFSDTMGVVDTANGKRRAGSGLSLESLGFSGDGRLFFGRTRSRQEDRDLIVLETNTGKERHRVKDAFDDPFPVLARFTKDGSVMATLNQTAIKLRNFNTGLAKELSIRPDESGTPPTPSQIRFSPGDEFLAAYFFDTTRFFRPDTGEEATAMEFKKPLVSGFPSGFAFSADGRKVIVTSSTSFEASVWPYPFGAADKPLLTLRGRFSGDSSFSPDGRRILTRLESENDFATPGSNVPQKVKLWDAESGREVLTLEIHPGAPVEFSNDGSAIVTVRADKTLYRFETRPPYGVIE